MYINIWDIRLSISSAPTLAIINVQGLPFSTNNGLYPTGPSSINIYGTILRNLQRGPSLENKQYIVWRVTAKKACSVFQHVYCGIDFNPDMPRKSLSDGFENNARSKLKFTRYLKEMLVSIWWTLLVQIVLKRCFYKNYITKIVKYFLGHPMALCFELTKRHLVALLQKKFIVLHSQTHCSKRNPLSFLTAYQLLSRYTKPFWLFPLVLYCEWWVLLFSI